MATTLRKTVSAHEFLAPWREEGSFAPDEQVTVTVEATPPRGAPESQLRFLGAGKGLFASAREIDEYLPQQRNSSELVDACRSQRTCLDALKLTYAIVGASERLPIATRLLELGHSPAHPEAMASHLRRLGGREALATAIPTEAAVSRRQHCAPDFQKGSTIFARTGFAQLALQDSKRD